MLAARRMMIDRAGKIAPQIFRSGGFQGTSFTGYNIATNTWDTVGTEPQPGFPGGILHDYVMESVNGRVYIIGGQSSSTVQSTVYRYDITSNTWLSHGTATPTAVTNAQSCVIGTKIYVICGNQAPTDVFHVQIYDTVTDTWASGTDLSESITHGACDAINGIIYLAGGIINGATISSHCWAYDPGAATWTAKAAVPTAKAYPRGRALGGKLYVCGGENGFTDIPTTTVQVYDPSGNSWSTGTAMPAARMLHAACTAGTLLYVFGGTTDGGSSGAVSTLWGFDGTTWTTLASGPGVDYGCGIAGSQ